MTSPKPPLPDARQHGDDEHPVVSSRNAHAGLWLFALYLIAYVVFMGLAAVAPETLGQQTPLGPNLAIIYGFGLIFGAVVLALVYMGICKWNADRFGRESDGP